MLGRLSPKYNQPLQSFPINSWAQEFDNASKLELDCIEWLEDGVSDENNPFFSSAGRKRLVKLQKQTNISLDSICCHSFITGGLISSDKVTRKQWIERLKLILKFAREINSKSIVIPLMEDSSINGELVEDLLLDSMNQVSNLEHEIQILFETDLSAKKSSNILKKLNQNHFGLVYDLGNASQLGHDVYHEIELIHDLIGEIHFKDKDLNNTLRLGDGKTNFELAAKALKDFQWSGRFILETPIFNNWMTEARHNVSFAKNIISSIGLI